MEDQQNIGDIKDEEILLNAVKGGDSVQLKALLSGNSNMSLKLVDDALDAAKKEGKAAIIEILKNYLDSRLFLDLENDEKFDDSNDEDDELIDLSGNDNKPMKLSLLRDAFHIAFYKHIGVPVDEGMPLYRAQRRIIVRGLPKARVKKTIIIVGAGVSGLCAGYELRRAGYEVIILEASQRVGGRVETWRQPFTHPLHTEAGAMRIPKTQKLIHAYLNHFKMRGQLEDFENNNQVIYLSEYEGGLLKYSDFEQKLIDKDEKLLKCFPGLLDSEKGKSLDTLWSEAVQEITTTWLDEYYKQIEHKSFVESVTDAWAKVTSEYDNYSVHTYLEYKKWSSACIEMYRLGTNQVLLNTSIIEMWRDQFLSLKSTGSFMKQLKNGMETFPRAFLEQHDPKVHNDLKRCITFGAKVMKVCMTTDSDGSKRCTATYKSAAFCEHEVHGDFVIFAVPYNIQRLIRTSPVFSPPKREAIETVRYVESTIVMLQFKTRWWENKENFDGKFDLAMGGGIVTDLPSRYAMLPPSTSAQFKDTDRGIIRASYTFQSDSMVMAQGRVQQSLNDFSEMFGKVVKETFEVGAVNAFSQNVYTGNSALCLFGPQQKTQLYQAILAPDWFDEDDPHEPPRAYFAGEQASYYHGWIQGALEAGLRVAQNISDVCNA